MRSIGHVKTGIGVALVLTSMLAGQALAQSQVRYKLELGGDNHAAEWKSGTRVLYSRGSGDDNQVFASTELLNYAVILEVEGVHQQPGHPSDGYEIFGAANLVFNLEILDEQDNPVTDAVFLSTINDTGLEWTPGTPAPFTAASAFALGFNYLGPGRLIDPVGLGGPRLEPIFTYPNAPAGTGTWIGMGAGFKEWNRTGGLSDLTMPGVGMLDYPNIPTGGRRTGSGYVPVAEGQIDVSLLPNGIYKLRVTPGNGNNVLRGDMDMYASLNRAAFAVAANQTSGDTITFELGEVIEPGIKGRYVFYNNSAWDAASDDDAIAPDKQALLPGNSSTFANYISYSKGLNGIMVDAVSFNRTPVWGQDIVAIYGNTTDPFSWMGDPGAPTMTLRPGEGVDGSDRLVLTWPDNAIPNTNWLLIGLFVGDGSLGIPQDDMFIFGLAIGEGTGDYIVNATDEIAARSNPRSVFNPAPIGFAYDYNRDRLVNASDEIVVRTNNTTVFSRLVNISW